MGWFYDNRFEIHPNLEEVVVVERVYCLPVLHYSEEESDRFGFILRNLPGFLGNGITPFTQCLPYWFGYELSDNHEDESWIYLTASVEPSGLQVLGTLPFSNWLNWTQIFEEQAVHLPHFEV